MPEKLGSVDPLKINEEILNGLADLESKYIGFFDEEFEGEDA